MHQRVEIVICSKIRNEFVGISVKVVHLTRNYVFRDDSDVIVSVKCRLHVIKAKCMDRFMHKNSFVLKAPSSVQRHWLRPALSSNHRRATWAWSNHDSASSSTIWLELNACQTLDLVKCFSKYVSLFLG